MVDRPPALSRQPARAIGWFASLAVVALQCCFLMWFLLEPLPNAGNVGGNGLCRLNLLIRAIPEVVPGLRFRESYLGLALIELSHVENLPQRFPIVLASGFIGLSALALGGLILRGLRLRRALGRWEILAASWGLGTTALALVALCAGRMGWLDPGRVRVALALPIVAEGVAMIRGGRSGGVPASTRATWSGWTSFGFAAVAGPFLAIMALGAMLPTVDFDAIEYHVQGPKEYFQAGRIAFLPHNVYTSMPFSIEMLHLLGMEVAGDWWLGALVGQLLVASFAPMAALMIGLAAARLGSPRAAWVAAVVYLTAPWIYRLAVLPYVEGPLCYSHAALVWAAVRFGSARPGDAARPLGIGLLVGALAGGAMATKYPALISAVLPAGAWAAWRSIRGRSARVAPGFALGLMVVMGPWLGKNVVDTGNPVYPLGHAVFGGRHWDAAQDAKWSAAHGPRPIEGRALVRSIVDVAGRSDWQSPLFAALAPLALLRPASRRAACWLWAYSIYLFLTWWLLTHRLDRFWLPILPPLAILTGLGSDLFRGRLGKGWLAAVLALGIVANATYCSTALAGLNDWLGDLDKLRSGVPQMLNPPLARLHEQLPKGARVLLVGQAAVFHLDRPVVYNTVFNRETIEEIASGRSPAQVRETLRSLKIDAIYVDWFEVERYRSPGNYGFTPFVTPEVFARLVEGGALEAPSRPGLRQELYRVRPSSR